MEMKTHEKNKGKLKNTKNMKTQWKIKGNEKNRKENENKMKK